MIQATLALFGVGPLAVSHTGKRRHKDWPKLAKAHLAKYPDCAVCGKRHGCVPHHIIPFEEDPSLEMVPENLITMGETGTWHCHLWVGHLGTFQSHNPNVVSDALNWRRKIRSRPA